VSADDRAALEPTTAEIAAARAGICDPTDPDEDSDSILATASGWMSDLIRQLRDALIEGDGDLMVRLVREMTAADRALDEVLAETTTKLAAAWRLTNGGNHG
jgi:hypothetical protein